MSASTQNQPLTHDDHRTAGGTGTSGAGTQAGRTPFWTAVGLVAGREMKVKMMSKAFVVTTAIMLGLLLLAVLVAPRLGDLFGGDGA